MKNKILQIEKKLDDKLSDLSIWELPYQSILTVLLYNVENVDFSNRSDTAMDYLGRLSHIYPLLKKYSTENKLINSSKALVQTAKYLEDVNFLNSYAHFSQLMPQIHRGIIEVKKIEGNKIILNYANKEVQYSELIDKLYSFISLQINYSFKDQARLERYTDNKVKSGSTNITDADFLWVKKISDYHKINFFNVQILPEKVFKDTLGFSYAQYIAYSSALRAFSDYFITLGRSYRHLAVKEKSNELMDEYFEWAVCCLNFKVLGWFQAMAGLNKETFDKILSFHLNVVSNNTPENFTSKGFCGDGYCPPITLMQESIIFSPLALRFNLNINNILYSLNKNDTKLFDEKISQYLEPTLIKQMEYLFSRFKYLKVSKNVHYSKGEIDLIVLSPMEETCLIFQIKTTIAPDSARTVARVESRIAEAEKQINKFQKLSNYEKNRIINNEFRTKLKHVNYQDIILVRSSAGSIRGWEVNKKYRITNYTFLASLLCDKLKNRDYSFTEFSDDIRNKQDEMIEKSNWKVNQETLKIDCYEIEFPDITYDNISMMLINLESRNCYSKMENS